MVGQLDLHRPLHQPLRQLAEQPARPGDLLLRPGAGEQLVDQLVRQQRLDLGRELRPRRRLTARSASASLRSPSGLAPRHAGAIRLLRDLIQPACDCRGHRSPFEIDAYTVSRTFPSCPVPVARDDRVGVAGVAAFGRPDLCGPELAVDRTSPLVVAQQACRRRMRRSACRVSSLGRCRALANTRWRWRRRRETASV